MRKPLALVLAIVLSLSLAACNGSRAAVTQEEHERVVSERDELLDEVQFLRTELIISHIQISELRGDLDETSIKISALQSELEGLRGGGDDSEVGGTEAAEFITFGDIVWRVLDIRNGTALIISENILFTRAYHSDWDDVTWEHSSLRQYLNGEFYNNTFSAEERDRIIETALRNDPNPQYGIPGGNDTVDKVFLLSIEEAEWYFSDNPSRVALGADGAASWWWLRSPGQISYYVAHVCNDGYVNAYGNFETYDGSGGGAGVRPALWLNLEP